MFHPLFSSVLRFAGPVSYDSHHKHTIHDNFLETTKISHFEFHAKFGMACCASRPNKGRFHERCLHFCWVRTASRHVGPLMFFYLFPEVRFGDFHGGHESQMNHIGLQLIQLNLGPKTGFADHLSKRTGRMPRESQKSGENSGKVGGLAGTRKEKEIDLQISWMWHSLFKESLGLIDTHGSWHSSQYVNLQIHVLHA